jgi:3-oxoacyl-[acyl-carrier protein] reductase
MVDASPVALVTGGASGIGWATAQEFLRAGWRVVIGDLDHGRVARLALPAEIQGAPEDIALDVRDQASVDRAAAEVVRRHGRIDILVNSAGIQRHSPLADLDWAAWNAVMEVNLNGALRCLATVGKQMIAQGKGSIVNIVSVAAERGAAGRASYAAAKAALVSITRTAAVEWAAKGVRVNAVGPGYVATELVDSFVKSGRLNLQPVMDRTPMGRMATPLEIARVIRFLASDDASYITGHVLYADGGFLADYGVPAAPPRQA